VSARTTRRLLAALSLSLVALTGCTTTGTSTATSPAASEESGWSYVSGSGETITLDHKPERIIASAAEAAGLMAYGIKPVGIYLAQDMKWEPGLAEFDLTGIEIIGEEWGHIDAEKTVELDPDLIVADWWPPQEAYQGFEEGVDDESLKVATLAPVIGASQQGSLEELIAWYDGFAQSMGVDVASGANADAKARFETAKKSFQDTVAAKPGLSALAVAPAQDMLYVAVPEFSTSLTDFKTWGLDVIDPDSPKEDFPYWEYLSWEKADKYQPDVLLMDDRGYEDNITIGEAQPTWDKIAAAEAKSYAKWPGYWVHTWDSYAEQLEQLTATLQGADPDIA
jgi:iron complex transport system substrate-binding protein